MAAWTFWFSASPPKDLPVRPAVARAHLSGAGQKEHERMSKEIYISSTPHETRLAIVENDELTEIYYERENEYTLAGSIYNGRVTRVLPGMQSSFVDIGLERDAFLYITDFLEEAGESADFDSADGRRRERPREGDRPRGDDRSRGEARPRGDERSPVVEGERLGGAEAGESRSLSAPERGPERGSERGGERGGERSRDRGGDRDRGSRRSRGDGRDGRGGGRSREAGEEREGRRPVVTAASTAGFGEPAAFAAPEELSPFGDSPEMLGVPGAEPLLNAGDLGEGEPGAEGSRRWRGRRGRRRGRGGRESQVETAGLPGEQPVGGSEDELAETPDLSSGYDLQEPIAPEISASEEQATPGVESQNRGRTRSRGRSRRAPEQAAVSAAPVELPVDQEEPVALEPGVEIYEGYQPAEGERSRERGREGRREMQRPRGFSPRGTPFAGGYGDEGVAEAAAPAEPIVLPGESLAKYRGGSEPETAAAAPSAPVVAAPVQEFRLPGAWDGGNVLPGETLRPRTPSADGEERRSAGSPERSRDRGGDRDRGGERRRDGGRGPRRDDGGRAPRGDGRGEPRGDGRRSDGGRGDGGRSRLASPRTDSPDRNRAPRAEADRRPRPESGYEPSEGQASHRFDPDPPREFRLPAGFGDDEGTGVPPADRISDGEHREAEHTTAESAFPSSSAHLITPNVGEALAPIQFGEAESLSGADSMAAHEGTAEHETTLISDGGEMVSTAPEPAPAEEMTDPGAPIAHETAVLEDKAEREFAGAVPVAGLQAAGAQDGHIEGAETEEFFADEEDGDTEDFHATTLHAASIEEMDYDDEPIETSADLGTMLRELSIDEITRPIAPVADNEEEGDDFAFEEEDSLDDPAPLPGGEADEREQPSVAAFDGASGEDEDEAGFAPAAAMPGGEEGRERGGRRDGRRGGRDRERGGDRGGDRGDGARTSSGDRFRGGRREGHRSAQTTNLPAISDLLKPGQELLVQIAKEPIAKKGARITSHIALPGRFLVFMPTVNHTGVSRKIESDSERRRLKEILLSEKGEATGGFIVRTAAAGATEEELRNDLRFLLNLWADIKQRSESSKSPALIYHDLNLVERILRDQVTDNFSAIWVDSEADYERILRFLQRFQPSLIRRVKLYTKETPLFEQFGISEEINKALRSKVWLKSGGSIVINQTEALVAIDINTGKYVGKTARLEDTIVKTNLDAIPEIVRQIRLRDLGGIIVIDFIDMDERKNRHRVLAALEEELKKDRAPSKVLQFNDFGLVAITRKRVKQSLERTLSTPCTICTGTGMVKSPVTVCNDIYVEMRKMQKHLDRGDVMLRVNPEVVKQLKSPTARWLQEMEEMLGRTILIKSDPTLHPEQFDIH